MAPICTPENLELMAASACATGSEASANLPKSLLEYIRCPSKTWFDCTPTSVIRLVFYLRNGGASRMTSLVQDFVYGIRLLRRARGFTIAVALTLGVGIAGTTTMFTLLNAMLLRPYPFSSPERLVDIKEARGDRISTVSL